MIKINENLYIDADDNQYMLRKFIGKDKDGEDIYKTITYHRTLKEVFGAVIRQRQYKLVADNELTLQEALKDFKQIEEETEKMLKEYIKEGDS